MSHDREFLKKTCTHTLELSRGQLTMYPGNVDAYLANVEERREHDRRVNATTLTKRTQLETFIAKNRAKASTASQARSKAKQLDRLELIQVEGAEADSAISASPRSSRGKARPCGPSTSRSATRTARSPATCTSKSITARASASSATTARARRRFCAPSAVRSPPVAGEVNWGYGCQVGVYAQHVYTTLPDRTTRCSNTSNTRPLRSHRRSTSKTSPAAFCSAAR